LSLTFSGRSSPIKRKAARIIDSMCRLVQEPADVAPFVPMLLPALEKVIDEIVDLEVCNISNPFLTCKTRLLLHPLAAILVLLLTSIMKYFAAFY